MKKISNIKNKTTLLLGAALIASSIGVSSLKAQKITGLNDFKIYLDPGHSMKENQGLYNYSEAEKTLRVALTIREYLRTHTDVDTVYMCRETDNKSMSLTERTDEANALGVDFFYSIHSDAGTPETNSTLFMYGGWAINSQAVEKSPAGGKAFGEFLTPEMNSVMRIPTRGLFADRMYYDPSTANHSNKYPYLHVNRESNMASLLSEAGYHTNPMQQQRNLNADWKQVEGIAAFRSILKYASVACPDLGFLVGTIIDDETGIPINGAVIKIASKGLEYTTDTYESLFNKYSKKPDELHNGFYFFDGLNNGETFDVEYSAPGHKTITKQITISTDAVGLTDQSMNFNDVQLLNEAPAQIASISATNLNSVSKYKPLQIVFNRKMDRTSVEAAISFSPATTYTPTWKDDYTLNLDISAFDYLTEYTLTIDGSIAKNTHTNNFLDGNADGTEGGNYVVKFTTAEQDSEAPFVVSYDPQDQSESNLARPVIRIEFNELIDPSTIAIDQIKVTKGNSGEYVSGILRTTDVNKRTVFHYIFNEDLEPETKYNVELTKDGIADLYGNKIENSLNYSFTTKPDVIEESVIISDFETLGPWWNPDGSGSTSGIVKATSKSVLTADTYSVNSTNALKMEYQWDEDYSGVFRIRLYRNSTTPKFTKDYIIQSYVFGDASGATFRFSVRDGAGRGILSCVPVKIDWTGWKLISWDITNDANEWWLATSTDVQGTNMYVDSYGIESPTRPTNFEQSFLYFDDLRLVKVKKYVGIDSELSQTESQITVKTENGNVNITADSDLKDVKLYTLSGILVRSLNPNSSEANINAGSGIYILKVATETTQESRKIIVK